jgi:hypothetical protein
MKLLALIVAVLIIHGCATVETWAEGEHFKINPKDEEQCANEGGCALVSDQWFKLQMMKAYQLGLKEGKGGT